MDPQNFQFIYTVTLMWLSTFHLNRHWISSIVEYIQNTKSATINVSSYSRACWEFILLIYFTPWEEVYEVILKSFMYNIKSNQTETPVGTKNAPVSWSYSGAVRPTLRSVIETDSGSICWCRRHRAVVIIYAPRIEHVYMQSNLISYLASMSFRWSQPVNNWNIFGTHLLIRHLEALVVCQRIHCSLCIFTAPQKKWKYIRFCSDP